STCTIARARRDRGRRTDVHVWRRWSETSDRRHHIRWWSSALRGSVPRMVVLTECKRHDISDTARRASSTQGAAPHAHGVGSRSQTLLSRTVDGSGNVYPALLEPLLFYVLHRVAARVNDPRAAGALKLCVMDEAWRFIQHET